MGRCRSDLGVRRTLLAAVALLLLVPSSASALDPDKRPGQYVHQTWGRTEGLPQVSVMGILQDRSGYLWIATQEGLARFDGIEFEVFDRRNSEEITVNYLVALEEGPDGSIWAATEGGGLIRHRGGEIRVFGASHGAGLDFVESLAVAGDGSLWIGTATGLVRLREDRFEPVAEGALQGDHVTALETGAQGQIWIGTRDRGLFVLDGDDPVRLPAAADLEDVDVRCLLATQDGALWIGTAGAGVFRWTHQGAERVAGEAVGRSAVESLAQDAHGNLWIGTNDEGLLRYTAAGEVARYGVAQGLSHHRVSALHADREGNLWIGTFGGGLNRLRDGSFTAFTTVDGLSGDGIWSVLEDRDGSLWVATEKGLDRIVGTRSVPFPGRERMLGLDVLSLHQDREGILWVGTFGDGLFRRDGDGWRQLTPDDGLAGDKVYAMADDPDGGIWVGTRTGLSRVDETGVHSFTAADGLPQEIVRALHVDREGQLWIGTQGGGLARFVDGEISRVDVGLEGVQQQVFAIHEEVDGTLWLGTTGGLVRISDGETTAYTSRVGLFDDKIYEIVDDGEGNLWLTCNRGVFRISKTDLTRFAAGDIEGIQSRPFNESDGIPQAECTGGAHPAGIRSSDGRLWFTTVDGLVMFDPATAREGGGAPPIAITRIQVDGEDRDPGGALDLEPGPHAIRVDFASPTLTNPEALRYRTWLEEWEADWTDSGHQRYADYRTQGAGRYVFHVTAVGVDGSSSEQPRSIPIVIRPHFHETLTFKAATASALVILGFCLPALRIRELRRRKRELEAEVDQRTRELQDLTEELKELALRDALTGLRNRRFLFETMAGVMAEATRQLARVSEGKQDRRAKPDDEVMGLFLVDIDHFKEVNDTHGHDAGDAVLVRFADVLRSCVRAEDLVVRWGGEEFLVVLPRTRQYYLKQFAERLRTRVAATVFDAPGSVRVRRTCSVGFTSYPLFRSAVADVDLDQLISAADLALYLAKNEGRNRSIHVYAGTREPEDDEAISTSLTSLEWATEKGYLEIER